ncbi:tRNA (adenosine(37)-N6)-dimethylallyltransferase MiaA [Gemmatimonas aurantiaca]|nr:tRNA (adenosine(37)-N6)-dimethylallyltransferase MiaA [Gemmatimonas aurantiaca]
MSSESSPKSNSKRTVLIVTGPTGSGKSSVAHQLAERHKLSIISADSRQVVRGFDIGSAKPSVEEQERYRYRMLDLINPGERFSAFDFKEQAEKEIRKSFVAGFTPVVCGGTGLYIRALTDGIVEIPSPDAELRAKLASEAKELGAEGMHDRLRQIDPLEAELIHPHNIIRVTRAIEMYYLTGKSKSELLHSQRHSDTPYNYRQLALTPEISAVYQRINNRVDAMIEAGWLDELRELYEKFGEVALRRAKAIGYTELLDHLVNQQDLRVSVELIKQNTRRFAKRQMTWLRGVEHIEFHTSSSELTKAAGRFFEPHE